MTRIGRIVVIVIAIAVIAAICSGCGKKASAGRAKLTVHPPADRAEIMSATVISVEQGGDFHGYRLHQVLVQFNNNGALQTIPVREKTNSEVIFNNDGNKYPPLARGSVIRVKGIIHYWHTRDPKPGEHLNKITKYSLRYEIVPARKHRG